MGDAAFRNVNFGDVPRSGNEKNSEFVRRLLSVAFTIATEGPLSLAELCKKTGLPKATAWRMAKELEVDGWIRVRLSDSFYEASVKMDVLAQKVHNPFPEVSEIREIVRECPPPRGISVGLGILQKSGTFKILDASSALHAEIAGKSLVFDPAPTAAMFLLSKSELSETLERYSRIVDPEERKLIESGEIAKHLEKEFRNWKGYCLAFDGLSIGVPWRYRSGAIGALEAAVVHPQQRLAPLLIDYARRLSIFAENAISSRTTVAADNSDSV